MKQAITIGLVLLLGILFGVSISPLSAQTQSASAEQPTCYVGEGSGAACSGKWIVFAGNAGNLDEGAWIVRVNGETGEVWYKNGRRFQAVEVAE